MLVLESHGKLKFCLVKLVTADDKARTMEDREEQLNSTHDMHFG